MEKGKKEALERSKKLSRQYQQMRDKHISDKTKLDLLLKILNYSYESGIELTDIRQFISEKIEEL